MSLKRSIKSKSRSLNLRRRDDDNSLKEVSTELIMKEPNFEGEILFITFMSVDNTSHPRIIINSIY
jgi:hypothetical protein